MGVFKNIGDTEFENAESFVADQKVSFTFIAVYQRNDNQGIPSPAPTGVCHAKVSAKQYGIRIYSENLQVCYFSVVL